MLKVLLAVALFAQIATYYVIGSRLAQEAVPFERVIENPKQKVLFAGDSTAYGTGASSPKFTTAGRLAREFQDFSIENISENGLRLFEFISTTVDLDTDYDIIVLQLGANDVLYHTPYEILQEDAETAIKRAKELADSVVWVTSGNIGGVEFFPWPISRYYEVRSQNARDIFAQVAEQENVYYVDLFQTRKEIFARPDEISIYAEDGLHLSDHGYGLWYREIRKVLVENGLVEARSTLKFNY